MLGTKACFVQGQGNRAIWCRPFTVIILVHMLYKHDLSRKKMSCMRIEKLKKIPVVVIVASRLLNGRQRLVLGKDLIRAYNDGCLKVNQFRR